VDLSDAQHDVPHGEVELLATPASLAPQAISQEEASVCMDDDTKYCLARAILEVSGQRLHIAVFDEPDAPSAAFSVNNLLIIACTCAQDTKMYFSLRLDDESLKHPLQPEEYHLLEPDARTLLLQRILGSLELCKSLKSDGSREQRLVVQPALISEVPMLVPDRSGVLQPSTEVDQGPLTNQDASDMAKLAIMHAADMHTKDIQALPPVQNLPTSEPHCSVSESESAELLVGSSIAASGEILESCPDRDFVLLASKEKRFGSTSVDISLRACAARSFYMGCLQRSSCGNKPDGLTLKVQIPSTGEPTRVYFEHRVLEGEPVVVSMAQQSFPHQIEVVISDPRSHEELCVAARDDAIMPLTERSIRQRMGEALEQLLVLGTLGQAGSFDFCQKSPVGRELWPTEFTERALQQIVPVVSFDFLSAAEDMPEDLKCAHEIIFSCSRYILNPSVASLAQKSGHSPFTRCTSCQVNPRQEDFQARIRFAY